MTEHSQTALEQDELLTITEVAAIVRAPVATLRYWRHLGTGPHGFRVGRGVRYWNQDVHDWLRQQSAHNEPNPSLCPHGALGWPQASASPAKTRR